MLLRRVNFAAVLISILALTASLQASTVRRHGAVRRAHRAHRTHRARRHHLQRIVWNPLFRGSHEMLVRENELIDNLQLPRVANDDELIALEESEELVPVESSKALTVAVALPNRRFCRPWTRDFLEDFSQAYYNEFHRPLVVTSLVRTAQQQHKLRRRNRNAAPEEGETASTHLTGATVDIYKRGISRKQHQWIEQYLAPLREQGFIDPIEERRQPVFHIMVFDTYPEPPGDEEVAPADEQELAPAALLLPQTSPALVPYRPLPPALDQQAAVQ